MALLRSILLILILVFATSTFADDYDVLVGLLSDKKTFSTDFEQISLTADGERAQTQTGVMLILRPNRFRWEVRSPVPQLVVSDGKDVYVYDETLKQVTVTPLEPAIVDTPVLLLSGDVTAIGDSFDVLGLYYGDTSEFTLVPKASDNIFEKLVLRFVNNDLSEIEMSDGFGQKSIIIFRNSNINAEIDIRAFQFVIPDDVDIFRTEDGL